MFLFLVRIRNKELLIEVLSCIREKNIIRELERESSSFSDSFLCKIKRGKIESL